jgi:hypothetical protein
MLAAMIRRRLWKIDKAAASVLDVAAALEVDAETVELVLVSSPIRAQAAARPHPGAVLGDRTRFPSDSVCGGRDLDALVKAAR